MAWLMAYGREHAKPEFAYAQKLMIVPSLRRFVAHEIARKVGVKLNGVQLTKRRSNSGWASYTWNTIALPIESKALNLGVIVHEVAHLLNHQKFGGSGHTGTFWKSLISVYIDTKIDLKGILLRAKAKADEEAAGHRADAFRAMARAQARVAVKAKKSSRAYKMDALRKRIAKNESRIKRLSTLVKSAKRSLAAYERAEEKARTDREYSARDLKDIGFGSIASTEVR